MRRSRLYPGTPAVVAVVLGALSSAAMAETCSSTDSCLAAVARSQDAQVQEALAGIHGTGAKLLALHSYLRAGSTLAQRWSWTEPQIRQFAGSSHEQALSAALQRVRLEFETHNPGYTVSVNPQVRSLHQQLIAWNANASVAAAARDFQAAADSAIAAPSATAAHGIRAEDFTRLVAEHKPRPAPTLAAPGLSRHGQMYAVDFHVHKGQSIVADTDSATVADIWVAQGWEQRLHSAVLASGSPFAGPLQDPHEPWHYDYVPPGLPGPTTQGR